jgi:hypothetical protein
MCHLLQHFNFTFFLSLNSNNFSHFIVLGQIIMGKENEQDLFNKANNPKQYNDT